MTEVPVQQLETNTSYKIRRAKIRPIPKVDNAINVRDYRLISILPILLKVYQNNILLQVLDFIEKSLIYNSCRSAFYTCHSMLPKCSDYIQKILNRIGVNTFILTIVTLSHFPNDHLKTFSYIKMRN